MSESILLKGILLSILCLVNTGFPQVTPPNYKFTLDKFNPVLPNKDLEGVEKAFGKGKQLFKNEEFTTLKWQMKHQQYHFPIIAQVYKKKIVDFHATLPSYFLHNIFHQSLITRYGKQSLYKRLNQHALYIWRKPEYNIFYMAACTVTCFPVYLSVVRGKIPEEAYSYRPLIERMVDN